MTNEIKIRECSTVEQLAGCVDLQRAVFQLPEVELSPVRHFIVTKNAGGFTLGAHFADELIGFVLSVPAFLRGEPAFYSHMTAVRRDFQSAGVGGKLKWEQRRHALELGIRLIKWTFEPVKARNAYFNLEKLGAVITEYHENFYGTDYASSPGIGLASDRLFAEWQLDSEKVTALSNGEKYVESRHAELRIATPPDWSRLLVDDPKCAFAEQLRIREEFERAFELGLICRSFQRDDISPWYLLYRD